MKTAALIVVLATSAWRFPSAQTPAEKEVLQFERDACKAFLDVDPAALERVLTARLHAHAFQWRGKYTRG